MRPVLRIVAIIFIFGLISIAWLVLGASNTKRTYSQSSQLRDKVTELWGNAQTQTAPKLSFHWTEERLVKRTEQVGHMQKEIVERVTEWQNKDGSPNQTDITVDLRLDQRLKGLIWYSLYDVRFDGKWRYEHQEPRSGRLRLAFQFPDSSAIYDQFRFLVDGQDLARQLQPEDGMVWTEVPVKPGQVVSLRVAYLSRGLDQWQYKPSAGVGNLENFNLLMKTDFAEIDFPGGTMSPSKKMRHGSGWQLSWQFKQVLTGRQVGMIMPARIQPGEMASDLAFSAPISLLFFFLVLFVLGTLRGLDIHPLNYLFLGGAFFSFHLLFSYSIDHLRLIPAFLLCSAVSLILVVTYLRLVISPRFAYREAAAAQLIYLVGFSCAHFLSGFTGLTITILSILTLFLLMQLTGRIRWSEVLARRRSAPSKAQDPQPRQTFFLEGEP